MSRTAKTWLIIAGILVVLGPALIVFSAAGGVGFSNIGREKYEEKTYEIGATFDQIDVKTDIANVVLATADECRVVCDSSEKLTDSAEVKNGALVIRSEKNTKWYDNLFSFSFNSPKIKVYLPKKTYNTLKIESETGDAVIAEGLTFGKMLIAGDTSDIACAADIKDSAGFAVSTGDITLGGSVGTANIATTTGDVVMLSVKGTGDISVATDTGDINIEKTTCDGCSIKSNIILLDRLKKLINPFLHFRDPGNNITGNYIICLSIPEHRPAGSAVFTAFNGSHGATCIKA